MESTIQEVVAILDRSGSMNGKVDDTLGGINAAFEQLKTEQEANTTIKVSVKLFDHEEKRIKICCQWQHEQFPWFENWLDQRHH